MIDRGAPGSINAGAVFTTVDISFLRNLPPHLSILEFTAHHLQLYKAVSHLNWLSLTTTNDIALLCLAQSCHVHAQTLRKPAPDCVEDEEKLDPQSEAGDVSFRWVLLPVASVSSKSLSCSRSSALQCSSSWIFLLVFFISLISRC